MRLLPDGGFSRRGLGWVLGLSISSFALAVLLTAFSDDLGSPTSSGTDSYSFSVLGHHAMATLLAESGLEVTVRRDPRRTVRCQHVHRRDRQVGR